MTTLAKTGRYQLLDELGRGAMGVVYRAHDPVIGRDVAVKTMHLSADGSGANRPEFLTRFQTEARAAGILTHPNIVVVYDAGEEGGVFYITMELVEGRSLQSLLDEHQSFPLPRAIKIIEQASSALDYAHKHNIIHRDVKPANLMITADDTVKITDFGTAKILRFNTTQTAAVIGTPSYMSPEQIKGKTVDGRSDIFALGVILYELVTGEKPFPGQNITTVIYKIVNEEPIPPRELDPSINTGLCNVISRALAKEPTARFQTCGELLEALKNHRSFEQELREELHASYLPAPTAPQKLSLKPSQPRASYARPATNIVLPNIAPAISVPSAGTLYAGQSAAKPKVRGWTTFWFSLLLLGVIVGTGYYVRPYTPDVIAAMHSFLDKKSAPPQTPSSNSAAPGLTNAAPLAPVVPAKIKSSKPAASVATPKQDDSSSSPAPAGKSKPSDDSASAEKPKSADAIVPPLADPFSPTASQTSPTTSPVVNTQIPLRVRMANLKTAIESRLTDAGISDQVHVSVEGGTLVLQGHLRPAQHQALLNKLRFLPDWAKVTDDILPL
ncbi:MAG TPA: protein kinase [Candidatus Acidoferrales bacterium]